SELQDTADHLVVAGRGKVIADASVAALIEAASGDRVRLRTTATAEAMKVLANAGAEVAATAQDVLAISRLSSERVGAARTARPTSKLPADRVQQHTVAPQTEVPSSHEGARQVPTRRPPQNPCSQSPCRPARSSQERGRGGAAPRPRPAPCRSPAAPGRDGFA